MAQIAGLRIHITGVVQGVGFRPFVYRLAHKLALNGWVRNSSAGVDIEADGPPEALVQFAYALEYEAPPLARIDSVQVEWRPANGFNHFEIIHSASSPAAAFQPISPDVSTCPDCLAELFDPADRRYRYPFINCTNCGPRFTIIEDIPYDRPLTTMAPFTMCPDCAAEYDDPLRPALPRPANACPVCGRTNLAGDRPPDRAPAEKTRSAGPARPASSDGRIVGRQGPGRLSPGLRRDQPGAVEELRRRKLRVDKPFAVMMADLTRCGLSCQRCRGALLASAERPIVMLQRRPAQPSRPESPRPGNDWAPCCPTPRSTTCCWSRAGDFPSRRRPGHDQRQLERRADRHRQRRSLERLGPLADAFLMHDRAIHTRCDDSVVRVFREGSPIRCAARAAMRPSLSACPSAPPLLATGAELKNTFCLTRGHHAFLSQHIGDLENLETLQAFEDSVATWSACSGSARRLSHDLHPDYLATRYALARAARKGFRRSACSTITPTSPPAWPSTG
jgi:hydrogenase maturation protein HypF